MLRASAFLSLVRTATLGEQLSMVRKAIWLCSMTLLLGAQSYGQNDSLALRQAAAEVSSHQYREALQSLAILLKRHAQNPTLWTLRGLALDGLGQVNDSLTSFDRALRIDSNYAPALEGASQTAYLHGNPRAMHYVQRLLQLTPGSEVANAMAGSLSYRSHNCSAAQKYFERSHDAVYQSPDALGEFADCLLKAGDEGMATQVLSRGSQLHPESVQLQYNLAVAELQNHDADAAIATLTPFATEKDAGLLNLLASAYTQADRPDDAFRTLESAIAVSPGEENNYLDLAILCLDHNQEQRSVMAATAGIARIPDSASLYLIRGVAYAQLAQYGKAEADFEDAARIEPHQPHSTIAMSLLYSDRHQVDKEKELLTNQLKSTPNDAVTNYLYADLLIRMGAVPGQRAFEEAQEHLARSLRAKPDSAEAQVLMGKILEQDNQPEEALHHFEIASKVDPNNHAALNRQLLLLHKMHRDQEAQLVVIRLKTLLNKELEQGARASQVRVDTPSP